MNVQRVFARAAAVIVLVALAGCGYPETWSAGEEALAPFGGRAEASASVSVDVGDSPQNPYNAEPVRMVSELAAMSDVGVIGTVASYGDGRMSVVSEFDPTDFLPVVLEITDVRVVFGELSGDSGGSVYVALSRFDDARGYESRFPPGSRVVVYGADTSRGSEQMTVLDGAPEGATMYVPVHPAALAFEVPAIDADAEPALVFWLANVVVDNRNVEDMLPLAVIPGGAGG